MTNITVIIDLRKIITYKGVKDLMTSITDMLTVQGRTVDQTFVYNIESESLCSTLRDKHKSIDVLPIFYNSSSSMVDKIITIPVLLSKCHNNDILLVSNDHEEIALYKTIVRCGATRILNKKLFIYTKAESFSIEMAKDILYKTLVQGCERFKSHRVHYEFKMLNEYQYVKLPTPSLKDFHTNPTVKGILSKEDVNRLIENQMKGKR